MEEEWAETEDEAEVQVLVLSPRCWAVSSLCFLDEPVKHFPGELCSYLNQFTQFYSHSEYQFTQFCSQSYTGLKSGLGLSHFCFEPDLKV